MDAGRVDFRMGRHRQLPEAVRGGTPEQKVDAFIRKINMLQGHAVKEGAVRKLNQDQRQLVLDRINGKTINITDKKTADTLESLDEFDGQRAAKKNLIKSWIKDRQNKKGNRLSRAEVLSAIIKYNLNNKKNNQESLAEHKAPAKIEGELKKDPRQIDQSIVEPDKEAPMTVEEQNTLDILKTKFELEDNIAKVAVRVIHGTPKENDINILRNHDIYVYSRKNNKHPDTEKISLLFRYKGLGNGGFAQAIRSVSAKGEKVIKIALLKQNEVLEKEIGINSQIRTTAASALKSKEKAKEKLSECFVLGKECSHKSQDNNLTLGLLMPKAKVDFGKLISNSKTASKEDKAFFNENKPQHLKEIIEAGRFLHQLGFVHRDLKPDNIFLHDGRAKLADFGLAIEEEEMEGGEINGTEAYQPPEIRVFIAKYNEYAKKVEANLESDSVLDSEYDNLQIELQKLSMGKEADCYAMGIILSEMILGEVFDRGDFGGPKFEVNTNKAQVFRNQLLSVEPKNKLIDTLIGLLDPSPSSRITLQTAADNLDQLTLEQIGKYMSEIRSMRLNSSV